VIEIKSAGFLSSFGSATGKPVNGLIFSRKSSSSGPKVDGSNVGWGVGVRVAVEVGAGVGDGCVAVTVWVGVGTTSLAGVQLLSSTSNSVPFVINVRFMVQDFSRVGENSLTGLKVLPSGDCAPF
jgi:hypothetical protein